ncbi:MAG: manganese efflux pump MntP [bacterium]
MSLWEVLILAFVLGIDAASVALAIGAGGCNSIQCIRLSFSFGSFQFFMPALGWLLGRNVVSLVKNYDHWIAFGLLFVIGSKMIYEAFKSKAEGIEKCDRTTGWSLIALSIATSIDALGAGIGMGILNTSLIYPSIIIGITAAAMTFSGVKLGNIMSVALGSKMEVIGGVILILLSIKMLITV